MSHPFKPIDAFKSPRVSQIATFMRLPHHRADAELDVALLGIPYDGGTSYRAGARFGKGRVVCSPDEEVGIVSWRCR